MNSPDRHDTETAGAPDDGAATASPAPDAPTASLGAVTVGPAHSLFATGVRNLLWLGGMIAFILAAGVLAFWLDQFRTSTDSETYESSIVYSERVAEEKVDYDIPLDYRLAYQGGTLLETDITPSNSVMLQTAKILAPHRPAFVAEYYAGRWRQEGMKVVVDKGGTPGITVLAVNRNTGESLNAAIKPTDMSLGESLVQAVLRRPVTSEEKNWFEYPRDLPMPPEGAELSVRGGGMGPSSRGRSYSLVVPMAAREVLDHYLNRMADMGWSLKLATSPGTRTGVTSYMCERGPDVYMMHVSRMDGSDRTRSLVMFMPF